jgi:hypothetical protein
VGKVNIIGIGRVGCNIASWFKKHPTRYRTFFVDTQKHGAKSFLLPTCSTHEEYESCWSPTLSFGNIKGLTYIFIAGSNRASGASLKILERLQACDVNVVYLQTESELRAPAAGLIYGVLQEYARSGKFSRIILCANKTIESAFDGMPVIGYYDQINDFIATAIDNLNFFLFNKPVLENTQEPLKGARLSTLSFVDLKQNLEVGLFPLDDVCEKRYYLGVSEEVLKSDKGFHRRMQERINQANKGERTSYSIYQMEGPESTVICMQCSPTIQTRVI